MERIGCSTRLEAMGVEHTGDTSGREMVLPHVHGGSTMGVGRRMRTRNSRVKELARHKKGGSTAFLWGVVDEIKAQWEKGKRGEK